MHRLARLAVPALCLALLGACAVSPRQNNAPVYGTNNSTYSNGVVYGQVRSIDSIGIAQAQPQGAGAVVGGVIGAVIGRQFAGSNSGRNVGTAVGAVGGAIIGNEIEKNSRRDHSAVRITVALDNGATRSFDFKEPGGLRIGDWVRIEGSQLYRM